MAKKPDPRLQQLAHKWLSGQLTPEEQAEFDQWLNRTEGGPQQVAPEFGNTAEEQRERLFARIQSEINSQPTTRRLWPRITAAASILLIIGAGTFILLSKRATTIKPSTDVAPYTAMAILKSGGKTIVLDHTANGRIAETHVTKSAGEQLAYEAQPNSTAIYDTIQIPAGGRPYTVKLSDGSKITLNAATTLRYPEAFSVSRKEQIELISGEIYAEVVHQSNSPLQIKAPGQIITDIGTEFNVSAYPDETDARTTLIDGSIKVNANSKDHTLTPGQQTILTAENFSVAPANIRLVTAWKQGLFRFNGEDIHAVMRQLARWYNIEVKYEGKVTTEAFYGKVARTRNISAVLRILERSNKVKFKVEGRRVTVLSIK